MLCKNCNYTFTNPQPTNNRCRCGLILDGAGEVTGKTAYGKPSKRPRSLRKAPEAVGTALESLIPEWAVADKEGCDCKSWVRKMDSWGVVGCEANRQAIISRLVNQKERLIPLLRGMPDSLARLGAGKLLDKAIKKASK